MSNEMMAVIDEIAAERHRQIEVKGWTAEHDDGHAYGEMALAASCYAGHAGYADRTGIPPQPWPWDRSWWKPKTRRRDLIRAAALIVAEIERLDRAALAKAKAPMPPDDLRGLCNASGVA